MKATIFAAALLLFVGVANVYAAEVTDTRDYHNTIQQLKVMHNAEDSVGPSATYWSQREMPQYIQNGCTEDALHGKQECPF